MGVRRHPSIRIASRAIGALLALAPLGAEEVRERGEIAGDVVDSSGQQVAGVVVVASALDSNVRHATATDAAGAFRIPVAAGVRHELSLADGHYAAGPASARSGERARLVTVARPAAERLAPSSSWLQRLPEGETKRWFQLDCTGCHQFNETRALAGGEPRSAERWRADAERMTAMFGPDSGFPVISGSLEPAALAKWLTAALAEPPARNGRPPVDPSYVVTEYDLPGPDLPHDLAVDGEGRVLVTGMFTNRILVLDPATGGTATVPIPIEGSGPRAIELDRAGNWWVLLGAANAVGRYDPRAGRWQTAEVGFYGHSIAVDNAGAAWTNDHFARAAPKLARVVATGEGDARVTTVGGPPFDSAAPGPTPIPYELRVAPDGRLWVSLLHGNQLIAHDPATGSFETVTLPDADAGPRRFDVGADGDLWIPGYASSVLYRYHPAQRAFERHPLPIADALPYVVRVDPRDGAIWIGTGAADAVLRFDPRTAKFAVHPVPTRGATMRHLALDPATGDVWTAYGASPAIHPTRIARLRRR